MESIEIKKYTMGNIRNILLSQSHQVEGTTYEIDDTNQEAVKAVCAYFADDPAFEALGDLYSLQKGLFIFGPAGTGKTLLMRSLQKNPKQTFEVVGCRRLAQDFFGYGRQIIEKYRYPRFVDSESGKAEGIIHEYYRDGNPFNHRKQGFCFDDLGAEDVGRHFGDVTEVMEQVLLNLYENIPNKYFFVHITSNLTADQLEARYGTRVRSRIRQMFNLIELTGADRRK